MNTTNTTDTTNNEHQLSEFFVMEDYSEESVIGTAYDTEWANIETSAGLGTLGSRATATGVEIVFTPLPSIDVEAVVFMNALEYEINDYEQELENDMKKVPVRIIK